MKATINKKAILIFAAIAIVAGQAPSQAATGVVNSGPSQTSSNSVVTLEAVVPHVVQVNVVTGTSNLAETLTAARINTGVSTASTDYQIKGSVFSNGGSRVIDTTVSTTSVALSDGNSHTINVALSGTIGGTAISTSAFQPTFTNGSAAININGDLDESTVDATDTAGTYSGSVTITSTIR